MEAVILTVCAAVAILFIYMVSEVIIGFVRWAPVLIGGVLAPAAASALGADVALTFALATFMALALRILIRLPAFRRLTAR